VAEGHEHPLVVINSVSQLVSLGQYILNLCEQGVVFVFNVPSWTCLSVYLCGQKLGNAWKILPVTAHSLWSIWSWFLFFSWRGEAGWGWGSRGLNKWKWEKTHCNIMLGNTLGTKEKWKETLPHPPGLSSQNLKGIKARHLECTLGPSIGCMKFLFPKEFITV